MKSEHRHELKTNELGRIVSQATPFFEKYSNYILVGLGAVIVVAAVSIYMATSTGSNTAGWTAMLVAQLSNSTEEFAKVADDYPNTVAGDWAKLIEAESYLENGIRNSFSNRESANSDLKKAHGILEELANKTSASEEVRKRALFALARNAEATADGNTAPAIELYKRLIREYKDDALYKQLAENRITALETTESKDFYAWFHKQDPKPEDRSQPRDGSMDPFNLPPDHPPLRPRLPLPEIPEGLRVPLTLPPALKPPENTKSVPPESTKSATPPAAEKPAEGTAPSSPEKTTGDKPAEPTSPKETKDAPADKTAPSPK